MSNDVKTIIVKEIMEEEEMNRCAGNFYGFEHYVDVIDSDVDVYNEDGVLLMGLRVGVIPEKICRLGKKVFMKKAKKSKSNNRGYASGKMDISKISSNVIGFVSPDRCKSSLKYKDGRISKYKVSNYVNSMIAGYYDKRKMMDVSKVNNVGRATTFTENNKDEWNTAIPFMEYIDLMFEKYYGEQYKKQKEQLGDTEYKISDTVFTTVTVNYNFRTAAHKDSGNMKDAYSCFTVCESGNWNGCYLGYPQYGICVNVREGDFLLMNPHEYHCNTEFTDCDDSYQRLSFVMYAREGLVEK